MRRISVEGGSLPPVDILTGGARWALIPAILRRYIIFHQRDALGGVGGPILVSSRADEGMFGELATPADSAHSLRYVRRLPTACVTICTCAGNITVSTSKQRRWFVGTLGGAFKNVRSFKAEPNILYPLPPYTVSYQEPGERVRVSSKLAASGERCAIAPVYSCAPFQLFFISERQS